MPILSDLLAQRAELEKQIEALSHEQRSAAIAQIRALMADHGLNAADLLSKPLEKKAPKEKSKIAARYRDPDSGNSWSGRGLKPRWLTAAIEGGRKLEDFAV